MPSLAVDDGVAWRDPSLPGDGSGSERLGSLGAGAGLTLALVLMASIRETTEFADVPAIARGTALVLIIAGSLSLAFMGFAGLLSST